jgi:hypothetical protein
MEKDPDLRAREISDLNGVIEAEHDLTKTRLALVVKALRDVKPLVHRYIAKCPEEATPAVLEAETAMCNALDKEEPLQ